MSIFDIVPLEDITPQESPFASENRGTFGDLMSGLFRGTASTTVLLGQGLQQAGAEKVGTAVRSTGESMLKYELAKPDELAYLGLDTGRAKQIAMGVAENAPYIIGTLGAGAIGSLAGPLGAVASSGAFLGITAGAGTYKATREELDLKLPDMPEEEKHLFAMKEAAIQLGTESIGTAVGFGAGKIFGGALTKPVLQAGLRGMVDTGEVSASKLMASAIGKTSVGDLAKSLTVAGIGEGSSEVAAQLLSEANRESVGLENDPSDLFNIFASAAILGGAMGGVGYAHEAKNIKRMRESINYGLSSPDPEIRSLTVETLGARLTSLDPEAGAAFNQTIGNAAIAGPVDLEQIFKIQRDYPSAESTQGAILQPWEANLKSLEQQGIINQVTQDPASILESEGIPTGVAPVTYSTNPYGTAEFTNLPPVVETPPYNPSREIPVSTTTGTAQYQNAISPYAMSQEMAKVSPDSNQLVGQTAPPRTLAEIQREKEAVRARAAQSQRSLGETPGTAQYLNPRGPYAMAKAMGEVAPDSNQVITQPQAQKEVSKPASTAATKAISTTQETVVPQATQQTIEPIVPQESKRWASKKTEVGTLYQKDNAAILKKGDRNWQAYKREPGKGREDLGSFKSFKHAKEAIESETTSQEYYKKAEEAAKPLTPQQQDLLKGADVPKLAEMIVNSIPEVRGDTEAIGVATEAIIDSARRFNPEKGVRFSTFAYKSAKGKVLSYFQKRSEIQNMERQALQQDRGEGSVGTSTIEAATKEEVQGAVPINIQEKAKEAPAPVTKPTLSEEEKAKILERVKKKTLAEKQADKSKVTAKAEVIEEGTKDEANVIVRKARSTFIPPKVAREAQAETVTKAQQILQRSKFNKNTARTIANAIRDPQERQEVLAHIDATSTFTIGDLLKQTLQESHKDSETYKLAAFLNKIVGTKSNTRVIIDPALDVEYFDHTSGSVFLRDTTPGKVTLHEIVHAVTARELQVNKRLKAKVRELMELVEQRVLEDNKIQIDQKLLDRMKRSGETSRSFMNEFGSDSLNGDRGILYALLNEKEFLAQAMNDSRFQELLQDIKVKDTNRTVWDYVVDFFRQIFGVSKYQENALREVLQLTAELAQVDLSYGKVTPAKDMIFIGEKALGIDKGSLLDAKYRMAQGDSRANIRKDTGWFKDADGFWRYEIDDSKMKFVPGFDPAIQGTHQLQSVISHPELFEKYPFLKELKVEVVEGIPGIESKSGRGGYNPKLRTIYLKENIAKKNLRKILVHEIQHAIQYKEGFSVGANSGIMDVASNFEKLDAFFEYKLNKIREYAKEKGDTPELEQMRNELFEKQVILELIRDSVAEIHQLDLKIQKAQREVSELLDYSKNIPEVYRTRKVSQLYNEISNLQGRKGLLYPEVANDLKYDLYLMVAGEVEARNVAARIDWPAEKRRLVDIQESQSINDKFKIFRYGDELSAEIDMADTVAKKTWADREKILAQNDVRPDKFTEFKNRIVPSITKFTKDIAQTSTERLRKINPKLLEYVRRFEFGINKYNVQYHDEIRGFLKKYQKMDRSDQRMLDLVLLNDYPEDVEKRWEILKKYRMEDDYTKVVGVLKNIYKRKQMVDLGKFKETPDYFPRVVKDRIGLIQAMKNDQSYGVIEAELEAAGLNEADREIAIQNLIDTGRFPALAILRPGADKRRRIERVSSEWAHFYMSSMEALTAHIYESNEAIEARRMFGDVTRKKLVKERESLTDQLNSEGLSDKKRKELAGKIQVLEDRLSNYEENWHEGISTLLSREGHNLDAVQQTEVVSLIRARLLQKGMTGFTAFLRNVSLMTALGGPGSAITQLTDLAVAAHVNGLKNLGVSLLGNKRITTKDLDLSHSMREFQTEGSAKFLEAILKVSGLKFMDTFGKNTFMNAAIEKAKNQSLEKFTKDWGDQLGKDTEATWKEIQSDKTSDLTRFFAFNALSEWQPTSMSEMPMKYLEAKNGRIFYALKSYNIKMLNNFVRELVYRTREARSPKEKALAIKDAGKLLIILTLAGATADELKDLIFGRDVDFSDNVHNNILKIFFMNTYMLEQGDKKGMVKTMLTDTLLPPTRVLDDAYTDIRNLVDSEKPISAKTLKSLPWGTLVYAHFTDDAESIKNKNIKEKISERVKAGESIGSFRQEMMTYNRWARKNNEPLITPTSIRNMRRRAKEKQRK